MAEAISAEMGIPMLYVRFDAVVSSLLGETAANLRKVFDYAQRGRWILFFDEFDAIGRSRDDSTEHGEIKRVLNSFLQIMDNFQGRSTCDRRHQLRTGPRSRNLASIR
jgi:SpoVK/Ycf46/Vps4 family AAA+-type ATPase